MIVCFGVVDKEYGCVGTIRFFFPNSAASFYHLLLSVFLVDGVFILAFSNDISRTTREFRMNGKHSV